jgi:hypothetical protein
MTSPDEGSFVINASSVSVRIETSPLASETAIHLESDEKDMALMSFSLAFIFLYGLRYTS